MLDCRKQKQGVTIMTKQHIQKSTPLDTKGLTPQPSIRRSRRRIRLFTDERLERERRILIEAGVLSEAPSSISDTASLSLTVNNVKEDIHQLENEPDDSPQPMNSILSPT